MLNVCLQAIKNDRLCVYYQEVPLLHEITAVALALIIGNANDCYTVQLTAANNGFASSFWLLYLKRKQIQQKLHKKRQTTTVNRHN